MYIGTDLTEKTNVNAIIDLMDFTFGLSSNSIPYQSGYGIDYIDSYNSETLDYSITSVIQKLGIQGLSVSSIIVDDKTRNIELLLTYNGKSFRYSIKQ